MTTKTDPRCAYMAKPGQNGSRIKSKGGGFLAGTGCAYMAEPVPGRGVSNERGVLKEFN